MSRIACQRTWQVEAARDGRLAGSDLSNALRHRSECADCKQAARALDELGLRLKALPKPAVDGLRQRRTRQALLATWNTQLLAEPRAMFKLRLLPIVAVCAVGGVALAVGYPLLRSSTQPAQTAAPPSPELDLGVALPVRGSSAPPVAAPTATELAKPASSTETKSRVTRPKPSATTDNAEDDAYLQLIELLRAGRAQEARAKANQYLARFPAGFRRPEVEKIAR